MPFSLGTLTSQLLGFLVGDCALPPIRQGKELNLMHAGCLRDRCKSGQKPLFVFSALRCCGSSRMLQKSAYRTGYATGLGCPGKAS